MFIPGLLTMKLGTLMYFGEKNVNDDKQSEAINTQALNAPNIILHMIQYIKKGKERSK